MDEVSMLLIYINNQVYNRRYQQFHCEYCRLLANNIGLLDKQNTFINHLKYNSRLDILLV